MTQVCCERVLYNPLHTRRNREKKAPRTCPTDVAKVRGRAVFDLERARARCLIRGHQNAECSRDPEELAFDQTKKRTTNEKKRVRATPCLRLCNNRLRAVAMHARSRGFLRTNLGISIVSLPVSRVYLRHSRADPKKSKSSQRVCRDLVACRFAKRTNSIPAGDSSS